jgi:flagellar biosynthesis protein FlhB
MLLLMCEIFQRKSIHFNNIGTPVKCTTLSHEKFILNTFFSATKSLLESALVNFDFTLGLWDAHISMCVYSHRPSLGYTGIIMSILSNVIFNVLFLLLLFRAVSVQWVDFGITCHLYLLEFEKICALCRGEKLR